MNTGKKTGLIVNEENMNYLKISKDNFNKGNIIG